ICEHFAKFQAAFGESLPERFKSLSNRSPLGEILSAAPTASQAARESFVALAELGEIPRTSRALRALASVHPGSDLLLARCLDALECDENNNGNAMANAEVALILREQFSGDDVVRQRLVSRFEAKPTTATAIALAIFAPEATELELPRLEALGRTIGDWTVA